MLTAWTGSARSIGAVLGFIGIASTTFLIVFALTPAAERIGLLNSVYSGLPVILAGVPGVLAWVRSGDAARIGQANNQALNGELDARIQANTHEAIATYMAARAQDSRATDPPQSSDSQPLA